MNRERKGTREIEARSDRYGERTSEGWREAGRVVCGGSGFDGGGKRKSGSLSESDCTERRGGGVYPANSKLLSASAISLSSSSSRSAVFLRLLVAYISARGYNGAE